jgi:hypothetical protein
MYRSDTFSILCAPILCLALEVAVFANPAEAPPFASRCAVTGDITASVGDVQFEINGALGSESAANDLSNDGVVNVVDVQIIINAVLQLGCAADPGAPPTISDFNPKSGPIGTIVTVTGENFGTAPQVSMPQQGGGTILVSVISLTSGSVVLMIPSGAASGAITVSNGSLNASSYAFTVTAAGTLPIFGSMQYSGTAGTPQPVTNTFQNCESAAVYQLVVTNGNSDGTNRVNSATVILNGTQIVGPADLSQSVPSLTTAITVNSSNTLVTSVGAPSGGYINLSIQCVSNCLSVQISSPFTGSNLTVSATNVGGSVTSSADEVGVVVNGTLALAQGGQFQAPNVPLALGTNSLIATATNACGNQATATIEVNATAVNTPAVTIMASPNSGVAPDTVTFTATVSSSSPITQYQWDFYGNGTIGTSGAALSQVSNTYANPGLYVATLTATDTMGNQLSGQIPILVMSAPALNTLIQARWSTFTTALANNDPNSALALMLPGTSAEFQTVFNELAGQLPAIAASLGNIALSSVSGGLAECVTIRHQTTGDFVYFIELIQDQNGLWKIESM